jgi:threonine synthase
MPTVFMLHPHGKVSDVQRRQMTTVTSKSVHNIALEGNFDDCQAIVKALFNDLKFRDQVASQVSTPSTGRASWRRSSTTSRRPSRSAQPGPRGQLLRAHRQFRRHLRRLGGQAHGLPVDRLVIATNVNDILDRTIKTGRYETRGVKAPTSPSMDIQVSSNFERLLYEVHGRDPYAVRRMMQSLAQSGAFSIGEKRAGPDPPRIRFRRHRRSRDRPHHPRNARSDRRASRSPHGGGLCGGPQGGVFSPAPW